ncbi:kelch repeat-containing protein [Jannaschia aquimarina]|uniref:NanM protein n=1 Tax=Jannaschia aquimarina TaxID=935700 RepID=A0A0D1CJV8_9RHOB|nr:kelch repeat-containing protein [Jannaschia aquimarina]KIT15027.1 N-acetylneuraminate epimerase precursor [Jannaschia aquimarina]SNS62270.1 Galactose oxidase, central domain [Jannaschia aquimarina]
MKTILSAALAASIMVPAAWADPLDPNWTPMPSLPEMGALAQIGRSGLCAGTSDGALLFAGGANFPEPTKTASRGGAKTYYDDVLILRGQDWIVAEGTIPVRADSFLSVQDGDRVVCIGGQGYRSGADKREDLAAAFSMRLEDGALLIEDLPDLPAASVLGAGGIAEGRLIATAGMGVYALDLVAPDDGWSEIAQIPGPKRSVYGGTTADGMLWIVGGRNKTGDEWSHYAETHALDLATGTWRRAADFPVPAGFVTVLDAGGGKLAAIGGVDADYFLRIQSQVIPRNKEEKGSDAWTALNDQVTWLFDHHPGFMTQLFEYDIAADAWTQIGWHPGPAPINRAPVPFEGGWVLAGGEVSAGKRTPHVWKLELAD